jgi:hypothetical protein
MSFNENLAERINKIFNEKNVNAVGKIFMGGFCFFVNDKMCVGLDIDKKTNKDRLMARIGVEAQEDAFRMNGCRPMDITGRPMKGFVFVDPEGFDTPKKLVHWVQLSIDHNPFAKSSKRKKTINTK